MNYKYTCDVLILAKQKKVKMTSFHAVLLAYTKYTYFVLTMDILFVHRSNNRYGK